MSPESVANVCQSCALCCDGTLLENVPLAAADQPESLVRAGGVVYTDRDGDVRLRQPCGLLAGCDCRVYDSRPAVCRAFRCGLLGRLDSGEIDHAHARQTILATQAARDRLIGSAARPEPAPTGPAPSVVNRVAAWLRVTLATSSPEDRDLVLVGDAMAFLLLAQRFIQSPDTPPFVRGQSTN